MFLTSAVGSVVLVLSLSLGIATAVIGAELRPYTAEYAVKISVLKGSLINTLRVDGDNYQAISEIRPQGIARLIVNGSLREESTFRLTGAGVQPLAYVSSDTISRDTEEVSLQFDWQTGSATGTINGQPYTAEVEDNLQDRLSIQYALGYDLMHGGIKDRYTMMSGDSDRMIVVRQLAEIEVRVPFGTFRAIPIQHQTPDSKRVTTLWCVAALDYLPVMIEQSKDGKRTVLATLKNYNVLPAAIVD